MNPKRFLIILALPAALALSSCSFTVPFGGTVVGTAALTYDQLPDCALVEAAGAGVIGDFVNTPGDDEPAVVEEAGMITLSCQFFTPETASLDPALHHMVGGLGIGVSTVKTSPGRSSLEATGMLHKYPAADTVGASVMALGPDFELTDESPPRCHRLQRQRQRHRHGAGNSHQPGGLHQWAHQR